jgi:tetratricopeptide (TPR) repeat protein
LLRADSTLASFGERGFRSTVQATLAGVYERIGEYEQARNAVHLADELAATDDSLTVAIASAAHARLALIDEDLDAAERSARNAVEHAHRTDIPFLRATALLELARVLAPRRRPNDARAAVNTALELLEAKGDQPRIAHARELLAQLDATPSHPGTLGR